MDQHHSATIAPNPAWPRLLAVSACLAVALVFCFLGPAALAAPMLQGGEDPGSGASRMLQREGRSPTALPVPPAAPDQAELKNRQFLPLVVRTLLCPTVSGRSYPLLEVSGPTTDRPAERHADLNLGLRGWAQVNEVAGFMQYNGSTDSDPPRLASLFSGSGEAAFTRTYRIYDWDWSCGPDGCRSPNFTPQYPVTLIGLRTQPGQAVYIPARMHPVSAAQTAMVLYAEERRITIKYTLEDNVVSGYTVHLEDLCIDPNLLQLYRAHKDEPRRPGLNLLQPLGTAAGAEVKVAVRDAGMFMDPRSQKDWWLAWP